MVYRYYDIAPVEVLHLVFGTIMFFLMVQWLFGKLHSGLLVLGLLQNGLLYLVGIGLERLIPYGSNTASGILAAVLLLYALLVLRVFTLRKEFESTRAEIREELRLEMKQELRHHKAQNDLVSSGLIQSAQAARENDLRKILVDLEEVRIEKSVSSYSGRDVIITLKQATHTDDPFSIDLTGTQETTENGGVHITLRHDLTSKMRRHV